MHRAATRTFPLIRPLQWVALGIAWILAAGSTAWAAGALAFDFPVAALRTPLALGFPLAVLAAVFLLRARWQKFGAAFVGFAIVVVWWLTLQPSNDRPWLPDVAQTAWADVNGDTVTFHNVRNCDYRTETDYTPRWETRTVRLSSLTGVDLAINYWGSPYMAHPIASFQFSDAPPLCFSIETRKERGESYSAIGGLYRQFELIYIVADERDVIRVRTNYRVGEDIYLYRTTATPAQVRERFLEYIRTLNALHQKAHWYNAITTNCTTTTRAQHPAAERPPWDWRILVNGLGDEMMFERHTIASGGLPFPELKKRALIDDAAKAADADLDFSKRIREGRPGF